MSWAEVAVACVASFLLTVVFTRLLIPFLKSRQLGKTIREDGPAHQAKAGTPTMGGLGMLAAIVIVGGLLTGMFWARVEEFGVDAYGEVYHDWSLLGRLSWPLIVMMAFAILGVLDDWQGLARKGRARELGVGLTARHLIALQIVLACVLVATLDLQVFTNELTQAASGILGLGSGDQLTGILPYLLVVVAIVGTVNGVNFADGLDGLCAGLLTLAFVGLGAALIVLHQPSGMPFIAAAACLGFLVFNRHPARVFMGNVASMGLGALLAALAIDGDVWYLLPIIGAVFVVEVVSDIIQIVYFKRTGGKRFFLMAPIHHHFEKLGWPETKIVTVFWSCGLVAALAGVGLAALLARS